MAQDRMHRASMRHSEKVYSWPIPLRFFWSELWGYCDDFGRGRYDNRLIVADTFPLDDEVTSTVVGRWMKALETAGVIVPYEVDGKRYFECVNWDEHQEIAYRKKTNIPDRSGTIPTAGKYSGKVRKVPAQGEGEREGEREGESADGAPPSEFCPDHPTGTKTKCGPCGDARRVKKAWDAAAKAKPSPRPPKADECRHRYVGGYCAECSKKEPQ